MKKVEPGMRGPQTGMRKVTSKPSEAGKKRARTSFVFGGTAALMAP